MTEFEWVRQPEASQLVERLELQARASSDELADFIGVLAARTSTGLRDWLDWIAGPITTEALVAAGFVETATSGLWRHPGAQLPAIRRDEQLQVALRVDDVDAAAQAWSRRTGRAPAGAVEGSPRSGYRQVLLQSEPVAIRAVERRSWRAGLTPEWHDDDAAGRAAQAWQALAGRPRWLDGAVGIRAQLLAAHDAVALVGTDLAASYFLEIERAYWQRFNRAGALQYLRQDELGLGWGNNDHHTFRSSRSAFAGLIEFLTVLGFHCREQFYAGRDAGWGAQVLENEQSGGVIFADVDLAEDEVDIDFAHTTLPPGEGFGTVGMWCALHGESLLGAGMHHLEGQFAFDDLTDALLKLDVSSMKPFSTFDHLRQRFTEAEVWAVPSDRLDALAAAGHLSLERAAQIRLEGAPGSHLENLARGDGFKGFNQHNVSVTMKATDPKHYRPRVSAS